MEISKTWCSHLWNHQFIGPGGQVKPCCRFLKSQVPKNFQINKDNTSRKIFESEFMNSIRKKMLKGEKVKGCQRCYDEENSNKKLSLRQRYNNYEYINNNLNINKPQISYLELCFNNLCNLRCRMCNPYYSTNWNQDWFQLTGDSKTYKFNLNTKFLDIKSTGYNIRYIKMTGGEPFLIKEYEKILEQLVELGYSSRILLEYSTNITIKPSKKLIQLWKKFKSVEIALSLDGTSSIIEYIRFPTKWKQIQTNIKEIFNLSTDLNNIIYVTRPTVMIYNILNIPKTGKWVESMMNNYSKKANYIFEPTHLEFPKELSVTVFPKKIKQIIQEKLIRYSSSKNIKQVKYICNHMNRYDNSYLFPNFLKYTKKLDRIRKESFKKSCPELFNILKEHNFI